MARDPDAGRESSEKRRLAMAIAHVEPGEAVTIVGSRVPYSNGTATIFKSKQLEVIRMVIPKGKEIPVHKAPGEITVQCLEGRVAFSARGRTQELGSGQLLYLTAGEEHALEGVDDAALLLTIVLV
jgi:quercetin dioxygenase-like cupin family protein